MFISKGNLHNPDTVICHLASMAKRLLGSSQYKSVSMGPYGREYWVNMEAGELFVRHARVSALVRFFEENGCRLEHRICGEFTQLYSRGGFLSRFLHRWNDAWFRIVKIPHFAVGNLLVFEKLA